MGGMARMRGTAFLQVVRTLRSMREAALRVVPPHLQHYLSEQISRTEWYSRDEFFVLLSALASLAPKDAGDPWERFGRAAARHDLSTVYGGMMVRRAGLLPAIRALHDLYRLYDDTSRVVIGGDDRIAIVDMYDLIVSADHCRFLVGFTREYLLAATGSEVQMRKLKCRARGDDFCRWEIER
jgi:hypothetical protein